MTTAVQGSSTATTGIATTTTPLAAQEIEDRFLKLLVTQMKNQDPLNPLDNAQITTQMAQLSAVNGITKLNDSVSALSAAFMANQTLQSASLIGHSVLTAGSAISLQSGIALGGIDLPQGADKLVVTIKDSAGNILNSMDLGSYQAGVIPFQWDGVTNSGTMAPDGVYTFEVAATVGGTAVTAEALSLGTVNGVTTGSQELMLNISGVGAVPLSKLKQVL